MASSLRSLLQDSTLAISLARKSKAEAERAAERAEGSAKRVDEASKLAALDVERAKVEAAEAAAQMEEAKELLWKVEGMKKSSRYCHHRQRRIGDSGNRRSSGGGNGRQQLYLSERIGSVVSVEDSSICRSIQTHDGNTNNNHELGGETPRTHYNDEVGHVMDSNVR